MKLVFLGHLKENKNTQPAKEYEENKRLNDDF